MAETSAEQSRSKQKSVHTVTQSEKELKRKPRRAEGRNDGLSVRGGKGTDLLQDLDPDLSLLRRSDLDLLNRQGLSGLPSDGSCPSL